MKKFLFLFLIIFLSSCSNKHDVYVDKRADNCWAYFYFDSKEHFIGRNQDGRTKIGNYEEGEYDWSLRVGYFDDENNIINRQVGDGIVNISRERTCIFTSNSVNW